MRALISILLALTFSAPAWAQAEGYDQDAALERYTAECDAGDRFACGYAILLHQRNDINFWLTEENLNLHRRACALGLDGSCWKFERRLQPDPYQSTRDDVSIFFPMVESGCENGSTMACWQAATVYLERDQRDMAWNRADQSCRGGFSDGCALRADIELERGELAQNSLQLACYGARPGYAPKAPYCETACNQGDGRACSVRANIYQWGRDGYQPSQRSQVRAREYYQRACDLGYVTACGRG
ncbi:MAG: hypothetical protein GYB36_02610 [Alphaproteobacteria bacterium]|nr:hypothetical protein [Alphaproteobacteria bacterium]